MKTVEDRFWKKVNKNGPNGCWTWTALDHVEGPTMGSVNVTDDHRKAAREVVDHRLQTIRHYSGATCEKFIDAEAFVNEIAHLLAEREEMAREKWRPIAEAPRDGTRIDVWGTRDPKMEDGFERYANAHWNVENQAWCKKYPGWKHPILLHCTHFMPLPAPPEPTTTDAGGDG